MITRTRFIEIFEEVLELEAGTVVGEETLADFETWDSLAVVGIIAFVHAETGTTVDAQSVKNCRSVSDLGSLLVTA